MSNPDASPTLALPPSAAEEARGQPHRPVRMLGPLLYQPRRRVLVVDDDEGVRELIVQLLDRTGLPCVVRTASDGMAGGNEIRVFRPHLIILDVDMPVVHGGELCQWVKADGRFPNTRVLMMTGDRRDERLEMALQAGADGWLPKPFTIVDFVSKVADLLARVA
jgi:CheY-like chemotaxis protein